MNDIGAWREEDFIREGLTVVRDIETDLSVSLEIARVFFHFQPADGGMDEEWGEDASYVPAARVAFERLTADLYPNYVGGWSGIEVFEKVIPTEAWLHERIPQMISVAAAAGIQFYAWSFEPLDGNIRTVSQMLTVMRGRSDEANELIDDLSRRVRDARRTSN